MSNELVPEGSKEIKPETLSESITTDIISNNTKEGSEQTDIAAAEPKLNTRKKMVTARSRSIQMAIAMGKLIQELP